MKRSALILSTVLTVTVLGSLSTVATANPAASRTPAAPKTAAGITKAPAQGSLKHSAAKVPPGRWAATSALTAQLRQHQPAPALPVIAHLAPRLNQLAGQPGQVRSSGASAAVPVQRDGTVEVTVTGSAAVAAARAVGARVLASFGSSSTVSVAPAKLRSLAGQPGVNQVAPAIRPMPQSTSEGVTASGAQNWASTGDLGSGGLGVSVGIVDMGFAGLQAEIAAGNFNDPDGNPVNIVYPAGQNHCDNDGGTAHGTAVTEIVHQMAPRATLYLYCIDDYVGFSAAASQVVKSGVKIVNCSLGFTGGSRGDGFGPAGSPMRAVKAAREAGVLWIQASGNSARDHWSGRLTDTDADGLVDLNGVQDQIDEVALDPGATGNMVLSWDQWPTSSLPVTLAVAEFEMDDNQTSHQIGQTLFVDQVPGDAPVLGADISNLSTDLGYTGGVRFFDLAVLRQDGTPALRYDLSYGGDVYASYLSSLDPAAASRNRPARHGCSRSARPIRAAATPWKPSPHAVPPSMAGPSPICSATTGSPATSVRSSPRSSTTRAT
jgi:hypothetical protein